METKAKARNLRLSVRKTRLVVSAVRGLTVDKAVDQLRFMNKKPAAAVMKAVEAAIASAVNDYELDRSNLFVKTITVDQGPVLRRWMPKARGRATPLRKPTCHVSVVVAETVDSGKKESKKVTLAAPVRLDETSQKVAAEKVDTKANEKAPKDADLEKGKARQGSTKKGINKMFQRKTG